MSIYNEEMHEIIEDFKTESIFESNISKEVLLNERLRITIVLLVYLFVIADFIFLYIANKHLNIHFLPHLPFSLVITILSSFAVYEGVIRTIISKHIKTGKWIDHPKTFYIIRYTNTLIETSLPTVAIFIISGFTNGEDALRSPPALLYFLFIILSALRLDFKLSLFTGIVAAVEYLAAGWLLIEEDFNIPFENIFESIYVYLFSHAGFYILGAVVIGMIGQKIRSNISRLKQSRDLLEDYSNTLEEKVYQRTQELNEKNVSLEKSLKEIKEMQNKIIMQEKMVSLGQLTMGVAHEIKNPLNFINNFAQITDELMEELDLNLRNAVFSQTQYKEIQNLVHTIQTNVGKISHYGNRADEIVKSMLFHTIESEGKKELIEINSLVEKYLKLSQYSIKAKDPSFHYTIKKTYDPSNPELYVVEKNIGKVLLNLVSNAYDSMHEKWLKENATGDYKPLIFLSTQQDHNALLIKIQDNGEGIAEEKKDKIFDPFFTTKAPGKGVGLGLYLCYEIIVEEHHGEITIHSEENTYTEVVIKLPIH